MDKTEQFIKMCDYPEIQEHWTIPPYEGDFYKLYKNEINVWHKKDENLNQDSLPMATWLPRQDQIQEMLDYGLGAFVNDFNEFCEDDLDIYGNSTKFYDYKSMEQLWLAFYMWEKHSKIWLSEEEKWVKK